MTQLEVTTEKKGTTSIVTFRGELDFAASPEAESELSGIEADSPAVIVVDLRELQFLDSTGLRILLSAQRRAQEASRQLVIVQGPRAVQRVFEVSGTLPLLTFVDDPSAAVTGA
jgi:anti-anti-sigma factor